jgi:transmembrane sensor
MNPVIQEEAAAWLIEFRTDEPDVATCNHFAEWLRTSPEHVRAYLELVSIWDEGGQAPFTCQPDSESLIRLARAEEDNVVAFQESTLSQPHAVKQPHKASSTVRPDFGTGVPHSTASIPRRWRRHHLSAIAASLVVLTGAALAWVYVVHYPTYTTSVGEQRTLALADGSTVELNARSSIRVAFTKSERRVELISGQALFNVVHSGARPFVVSTEGTLVEDIGTQFAVTRSASSTVVTVLEGVVSVSTSESAPSGSGSAAALPVVLVSAGEQVSVGSGGGVPRPHRANVAAATAWTQQHLVFESTPLPEAADAFNRFNSRQLLVEGVTLADFHVSGTFPARDPTSLSRFVLFLREQPGIEVLESDEKVVIRPK